ncbi:MAG: YceI family protein [Rhizobacter sp.]|nr:YceI family protein [Bacteriovorax sp.]
MIFKSALAINLIILFYIIQRVMELIIGRKNEEWLKKNNDAYEVSSKESLRMKIFHISWFVALIIESNFIHNIQPANVAVAILLVLSICQIVRFYTMAKLKQFWTVKVLSMREQVITTDGLYKFIRHPNYLIVIIELLLLPLLFKAYITMTLFSVLNLFVLSRRIQLEEDTLMKQTSYQQLFSHTSRLIPFIFSLLLFFATTLQANEINFHYNNYAEAKKSPDFVKFENTSTKLGMITTGFDGYSKDIKVQYTISGEQLTQLETSIPVASLDTDAESRDKKMHNDIMDAEKFPKILVSLPTPIALVPGEYTVDMIFTIKDKKIKKPVKYSIKKSNGNYSVSGSSTLGLTEAGLPDPSIFIAKVKDTFDLKFSVTL